MKITISRVKHVFLAENLVKTVNFVKDFKFVYFDILGKIAYSNDDNSATVSKLTAQGSHDRQATELPVVAALVLTGL